MGEEEGEMTVGEAGDWDGKDTFIFRVGISFFDNTGEGISDSGEGSRLPIEYP